MMLLYSRCFLMWNSLNAVSCFLWAYSAACITGYTFRVTSPTLSFVGRIWYSQQYLTTWDLQTSCVFKQFKTFYSHLALIIIDLAIISITKLLAQIREHGDIATKKFDGTINTTILFYSFIICVLLYCLVLLLYLVFMPLPCCLAVIYK